MTNPSTTFALADTLQDIAKRWENDPHHLLQMLIEWVHLYGWIDESARLAWAQALSIPESRIDALTSFYSFLPSTPQGRYCLRFSHNITDVMQGVEPLIATALKQFNVDLGKVSADGRVSIHRTSCTGLCDQGPSLLVNGIAMPNINAERLADIIAKICDDIPMDAWPPTWFAIQNNIRRADVLLRETYTMGAGIRSALALGKDGWLTQIKNSGLRGRGGAGFSTGLKWQACSQAPGASRVIVCNADEGEPGTFKDRVLLTQQAGRVFEGMVLAAFAINARQGFVYLRGEYTYLKPSLERTLENMRAKNWLGKNIGGVQGFDFDISIHLGAGAYICGEETALIESLEGKAGRPRVRPPFPTTAGYRGLPTSVNNVETLALATLIAEHHQAQQSGSAWFSKLGTEKSRGTKLLSISGDCAQPGIYEYPFGVTIAQILSDCGAENTLAVQVGGAAGITLAERDFQRKLAFEDVPTAGSFMVFNTSRDVVDIVANFTHFFAHESCGFCTPCRVGSTLAKNLLDKITSGRGTAYELTELLRVQGVMKNNSHCGLGQAAGNCVVDTLIKFRPAYERRLASTDFIPAFDLDASLAKSRDFTQRDDDLSHLS